MENFNYNLYCHVFPNGKMYIGITKQDPEQRWKNGEGYKGQQVYLAIQEFGWENVLHEVLLTNLSLEEAEKQEQEYIARFNTTDPDYGYNVVKGGSIPKEYSDEDVQNFVTLWKSGKLIKEIAEITHSDTTYISKKLKENGITEEEIKERQYKNLQSSLGQEIYQYDFNGRLIQIHPSIRAAAKFMDTTAANIRSCVLGRSNSACGFIWLKSEDVCHLEERLKTKKKPQKSHKKEKEAE